MPPVKRQSYTASFKLQVIERAEKMGNRRTAREFDVNERCIRRWKKEKESLALLPKMKRARRKGTVGWPVLEANLAAWIKEQKNKGIRISTALIDKQAKLFAELLDLQDFKGGPRWCFCFTKRNNLSVHQKPVVEFQKKEGNCSSIQQNDENPNLNKFIAPDVGVQDSVNTDMETQNGVSSNLNFSNIIIKQEIMETEPESSPFDEQRPSTSYEQCSESSNSNADALTTGQVCAVTAPPTLPHGSQAIKVEPNALLNYREMFPEINDVSSIAPRILTGSDPERSMKDESYYSVSNTTGSESSSSNQISQLEISCHIESPSLPLDSNSASHEPSCINESTQLRANLPRNFINGNHEPSRCNDAVHLPQNSNNGIHKPSYNHNSNQLEAISPQNVNDNASEPSCSNESARPKATSHLNPQFPSRDRFDIFGEFIASKLRNLEPKLCSSLQTAFADLIFKAELENYSNKNQISVPVTQTDSVERGAPSNEFENTHESSGKENIQPKTSSHKNSSRLPPDVNIASRNEITQHKILPHIRASNPPTTLINKTGSDCSLRNEPLQPTVTSRVESLRHLVLNLPENTSINSANRIRTSSQNVVSTIPPVLEAANSMCEAPTQPFPFLPRPKDEFDTFGEFTAIKLRNLDSKLCSIVQIAFVDLIAKAESGRFTREGESSIFANQTNVLPSHGYVSQKNMSNYESQSHLNSVPPYFLEVEEVPFEIIPNMDTVQK